MLYIVLIGVAMMWRGMYNHGYMDGVSVTVALIVTLAFVLAAVNPDAVIGMDQ